MTGRPADPGLDADLATLRDHLPQPGKMRAKPSWDALGRVEAKLARLREERDALRESGQRWAVNVRQKEAECARLRQALEHVLDCRGPFNGTVSERGGYPAICTKCETEAREALAGPDTPADSQDDKT